MLARIPPTVRCPFRFSSPAAFASFTNLASRFFVSCYKRNIHQGAVFFNNGSLEQLDSDPENHKVILLSFHCLSFIAVKSAHFLEPFEYFAANVNAICRRCIVQEIIASACVLYCSIVGVPGSTSSANQVLTNNDDNSTGRSDVLLNSTIDNTVFCHINRFRQKAGRNIRY